MGKGWMLLLVFVAVFGFLGSANATVITFDSVPGVGNPNITNLDTDGFTFTSQHFHMIHDPLDSSWYGVYNGTFYICEEGVPQPGYGKEVGYPITMVNTLGNPFSLTGFDAAEVFEGQTSNDWYWHSAEQIVLQGVLVGGGTLSATFALDGLRDGQQPIIDFQTFSLPPGWTNLASVTFSGGLNTLGFPGGISLDNIVVIANAIPTPEPTTMLLLGLGLISIAGVRRTFKK